MFISTAEEYLLIADFFVVPILMAVFSVTSFFSELRNGACFDLVQTEVGKTCWIIGTICMAVNALLIAIRVPAI